METNAVIFRPLASRVNGERKLVVAHFAEKRR
jgi:hypothetical protein